MSTLFWGINETRNSWPSSIWHKLKKEFLLMSTTFVVQSDFRGIILTHPYLVNSKIPTASLGKLQRMNTVTIMQPILVRRNSLMFLWLVVEILSGILAWILMLITRSIIVGRMAVEKIGWKIWSKNDKTSRMGGWPYIPDKLDKIWRDPCQCEKIPQEKAFWLSLEGWARQRRL